MAQPLAAVQNALRRAGLAGEEPVVVLLSGGADSLALLHGLVAVRATPPHALHLNYGLRGEGAQEDQRHCEAVCAALGVPLKVVGAGPPPRRGNLMAWARALRYKEGKDLARTLEGKEGKRCLLAVGHTADDQLETILYRLCASPGRRALRGMARRRGRVVRPLLSLWHHQTEAYCRTVGLSWREDRSNRDLRFARARVRFTLRPALRSIHPSAEQNVLRSAALLRAEGAVLDRLVAAELGAGELLPLARLEELPPPLGRLLLIVLAERASGRPVPQAGRRLARLLALGRSLHGHGRPTAAKLDLGGGATAVVERGMLRVVASSPGAQKRADG